MSDPAYRWFKTHKSEHLFEAPRCQHVAQCGGCLIQDRTYASQLRLKQDWVQERFTALGFDRPIEIEGLDDPWRYRNKVALSFGEQFGALVLGYHPPGVFNQVVPIQDCHLLPERMNRCAQRLLELAQASGLAAHDPKHKTGTWRRLLIRDTDPEGIVAVLVASPEAGATAAAWAQDLQRQLPELKGLLFAAQDPNESKIAFESLEVLYGADTCTAQIGPYTVQYYALNFMQASHVQAEKLYRFVAEQLTPDSRAIVWDLYCGVGVLSLYLAKHFGAVYGIESDARAIECARRHAERYKCEHVHFECGLAERLLKNRDFWLSEARPKAVVIDPPRAGLHSAVIRALKESWAEEIVYISCDVQSLVRDLKSLCGGYPGYALQAVRIFDLFPQTHHCETVVKLKRKALQNSL